MPRNIKNNSGFTLIELVIVVAIIGILATAIITGTDFIDQRAQSMDVGNYNVARNLQASFEQYLISTQNASLNTEGENGKLIANNDENIKKLIDSGILKSGYQIPSSTFYLKKDGNSVVVQFKLTSKRYKTSTCEANVTDCWFAVPNSGTLK
jgi:prepilin-type N-terminal cleavage/methylation domain-containing protein